LRHRGPGSVKRQRALAASWESNADAWTTAVRSGAIPSRAAGTDAAIVAAVRRQMPDAGPVLDVGCGEGWLVRALRGHGYDASGVDGSPRLIDRACELGGADFRVATYEQLTATPALAGGPYASIVLNFALLGDEIHPLLGALATRLTLDGNLTIQTVHPWIASGDARYEDGWRTETFGAFGSVFPSPMPWYFRTLGTWMRDIDAAGLVVTRLEEPLDAETGRPLSLLLACARS
jgi:SAM-dependent methyltransferase